MADQTPPTPEQLQTQLNALLAQLQVQPPQAPASGWARPQASAAAEPQSVSIPIKINTPSGSLRTYLNFDGSAAQSPEALMALIESLERLGMPLDFWRGSGAGAWVAGRGNSGGGWRR